MLTQMQMRAALIGLEGRTDLPSTRLRRQLQAGLKGRPVHLTRPSTRLLDEVLRHPNGRGVDTDSLEVAGH